MKTVTISVFIILLLVIGINVLLFHRGNINEVGLLSKSLIIGMGVVLYLFYIGKSMKTNKK